MNFKRGFSLIEVSVSLLILSVAVMSVYQTLSSTTLSIFSLENRVIAREIANNRISLINTLEKPFNQKNRSGTLVFYGDEWEWKETFNEAPMKSYIEYQIQITKKDNSQVIYETKGFLKRIKWKKVLH